MRSYQSHHCRPPNKQKYEHPLLDQTAEFRKHDLINCAEQLNESFCPAGCTFKKNAELCRIY